MLELWRGEADSASDRFERGRRLLAGVVQADPTRVWARFEGQALEWRVGLLSLWRGDLAGAERHLTQSIRQMLDRIEARTCSRHPRTQVGWAYLHLAQVHGCSGTLQKEAVALEGAAREFGPPLDRVPNGRALREQVMALLLLASAQKRLGDTPCAEAHLRRAIDLLETPSPSTGRMRVRAWTWLGALLAGRRAEGPGQPPLRRAEELAVRLLRVQPDEVGARDALREVHEELERSGKRPRLGTEELARQPRARPWWLDHLRPVHWPPGLYGELVLLSLGT
jgi:tetratricopeptide (TPR) repeat protein